jgi:hypothetical protein
MAFPLKKDVHINGNQKALTMVISLVLNQREMLLLLAFLLSGLKHL